MILYTLAAQRINKFLVTKGYRCIDLRPCFTGSFLNNIPSVGVSPFPRTLAKHRTLDATLSLVTFIDFSRKLYERLLENFLSLEKAFSTKLPAEETFFSPRALRLTNTFHRVSVNLHVYIQITLAKGIKPSRPGAAIDRAVVHRPNRCTANHGSNTRGLSRREKKKRLWEMKGKIHRRFHYNPLPRKSDTFR